MRTLLIDADVLAYKSAAKIEQAIEWEPGFWTWHCDEAAVKDAIDGEIASLIESLNATDYKLCLTDSDQNFRKSILPSYKSNRAGVKKPLVLKTIREWLISERNAYLKPTLEGDDVLGILSTWSGLKGEKVIVSIDKDMKTIPGLYFRDVASGIVEITEGEADYWHLYQTLTGDTTDGYSGCPGTGPNKALSILEPFSDTYDRPSLFDPAGAWERIVEVYEKVGLSEADALQQARVARILRASDYDFKKKEPRLWYPKLRR